MSENERAGDCYPCPKCGKVLQRNQYHYCGPVQRVPGPDRPVFVEPIREAAAEGKDKSLIWDDCAECAYKHLTAAYAAFTTGAPPSEVAAAGVYVARAWIAMREAETGYDGNAALAVGCLAMAELLAAGGNGGSYFRDARFRALERDYRHAREIIDAPSAAAFVAAHFAEALRELPALADRFQQETYFRDGGFSVEDPAAFAELLIKLIRWVSETYEIGGAK